MIILDDGHEFLLNTLDDGEIYKIRLTFVKRDYPPEKYPGNIGHYPGTTIQEVQRAIISRLEYVDNQFPCFETKTALNYARLIIWNLELRAARRHGRNFNYPVDDIEKEPTCNICGHIGCHQNCRKGSHD